MPAILITNDDGMKADGLIRLAEAARAFGEVWVVAPAIQRSAASHSITLHSHIDVFPVDFPVEGVHAFACSGTPADCVRVGALSIMPEKPDAVLSGINYGYNVASDIQYSATVGAALEAAFQGFPAMALSEDASACHEVTDAFLGTVLKSFFESSSAGRSGGDTVKHYMPSEGMIVNVNFPGCPLADCRGILGDRKISRGMFYRDQYEKVCSLEDGGVRLMVKGIYNEDAEEGTDFKAVVDRYVSVGPVRNVR